MDSKSGSTILTVYAQVLLPIPPVLLEQTLAVHAGNPFWKCCLMNLVLQKMMMILNWVNGSLDASIREYKNNNVKNTNYIITH